MLALSANVFWVQKMLEKGCKNCKMLFGRVDISFLIFVQKYFEESVILTLPFFIFSADRF